LIATGDGGKRYDRFRGRLMFPICNEGGQVVAFSGRLLDPDAKAAKYVNSPETSLFSKSRILYGLDKTKRTILDQRVAIICEGQIDLIRCYEHGFKNVVAPQGTAFTEHHGRLLKRYADEVILCFDADGAGQRAAERSVETLLESGINVRIAKMPAGDDPDTLLLGKRRDEFEKIIASAPDYTRHLLETFCRENDVASPRGRTAVAEKMAAVVKKIPSPVQREIVATEVAARLQIPLAAFFREVDKVKSAPSRAAVPESPAETAEVITAAPAVAEILSILLANPELAPFVQRQLNVEWLQDLDGAEVVLRLLDVHANDAWEDGRHFLADCPDAERNLLAGLILNPVPFDPSISVEALTSSLVQSLHEKWRLKRLSVLEQEIKSNLLTPEQMLAKSKELLDIKRAHG
jgi:DNA primase